MKERPSLALVRLGSVDAARFMKDQLKDINRSLQVIVHVQQTEAKRDKDKDKEGTKSKRGEIKHKLTLTISAFGLDFSGTKLVLLVEKGKMGDTFPDHFSHFDLRARYQNVSSRVALIQDVGRAFG